MRFAFHLIACVCVCVCVCVWIAFDGDSYLMGIRRFWYSYNFKTQSYTEEMR